jgi:hypothetical protein
MRKSLVWKIILIILALLFLYAGVVYYIAEKNYQAPRTTCDGFVFNYTPQQDNNFSSAKGENSSVVFVEENFST